MLERLRRGEPDAYQELLARYGGPLQAALRRIVPADAGIRITAIVPGGAAAEGGLKEGDVIVGVDGAAVGAYSDLPRIVTFRAGEKIEFALKDGRKVTVTVGVSEAKSSAKDSSSDLRERVGVEVTDLSKDLRRYLDLPQDGEDRVVITKVFTGSPAESAGLRKGDVILAVDQEDIKSESALAEEVRKSKKGSYSVFEVLSEGRKIKVIVTLK